MVNPPPPLPPSSFHLLSKIGRKKTTSKLSDNVQKTDALFWWFLLGIYLFLLTDKTEWALVYSPETCCLHLQIAVHPVQHSWICRLGVYLHKEISLAPSTSQTKGAVQQGKVCWHGVLDCGLGLVARTVKKNAAYGQQSTLSHLYEIQSKQSIGSKRSKTV